MRAAIAAVALAACAPREAAPQRLAGHPRTSVVVGEDAARSVARLHDKDVAPEDSAIAVYGDGALTLFVSRYDDARAADAALARMLARIGTGRTPFTPPAPVPGRAGIYAMRGPGGHHAVWGAGAAVYWLQGEPALVERAVAEGALPLPPTGRTGP